MFGILLTLFTFVLLDEYVTADFWDHLKREKCINDLGCFSANSPFFDIVERPVSLLPDEREDINTRFLLFTPSNPTLPKNFTNTDGSTWNIFESNFNPQADTKFVVPGFISNTAPEWRKPLIEALLTTTRSNVFLVDWTGGDGPLYEQAVANTRVVGAEIALFIKHLGAITKIQPQSVHIIGHSLGSHIAGYAGKRLQNLGRITAMDPAGPYFTNVDPVVRLDRKDALLVDAIHTNAAASRFQGFGLAESIGHFDFYPNGGHLQPGCKDMGHAILAFLQHPTFDADGLREIQCNHDRAIYLFISSILNSSCDLTGVICSSWEDYVSGKCGNCKGARMGTCLPLGMHVDRYTSTIKSDQSLNIYLNTTDTEPFCVQ